MKMKSVTLSSVLFVLALSLLAPVNAGRCRDDPDFTFKGDFSGTRDCDWLSERSSRQDKYCNTSSGSGSKGSKGSKGSSSKKIKKYCKKACNYCNDYDDDYAPSMVPSLNTFVPSSMPSEYDKPKKKMCRDNKFFKFESELKGVKDCKWLSAKPKRKYKYCETQGWDGKASSKVKFACKRSCANFLDGSQFDKCNKFEDDDYIADLRPYDDDDDVDCRDERQFKFKTEFVGKKKCSWLAKKEDRKEKYCESRGWDDVGDRKVKYACQASCGCL